MCHLMQRAVTARVCSVTWQTPVREVLGDDFYLSDALRTQHTTLSDLYGHRLGMPGNNAIRIAGYSLEELVR